jgi:hypothetical protein
VLARRSAIIGIVGINTSSLLALGAGAAVIGAEVLGAEEVEVVGTGVAIGTSVAGRRCVAKGDDVAKR